MTWQPIDEETYIDDTLVTCAEYQLFIDEMREQGKYYQPDHWTSYQFPKGQAQEPILGVRYADAVVFCAWLMQRENGVCTYSLPVQETTKAFPVKSFVPSLLGYWVIEKYQFAWVSSVPEDAREIDIDLALDQGLAPYGTGDVAFNLFSTQNLESALTLADSRSTNCAFINRALVVALDNFRALRLSQALVNELSLAIHYNIENYPFLDLDIDRDEIHRFALEKDEFMTIVMTARIYIDILTLQERIAGRSAAFEGIRLVKERVK